MIIQIFDLTKLLALVIRFDYKQEGIKFFTPSNFPQQLAYMNRPRGYIIEPHTHQEKNMGVNYTQEVLIIKSGSVMISIYNSLGVFIDKINLLKGDVILLADGGHALEMLEDTEIIEVKNGPYIKDSDKEVLIIKNFNLSLNQ